MEADPDNNDDVDEVESNEEKRLRITNNTCNSIDDNMLLLTARLDKIDLVKSVSKPFESIQMS